MQFWSFGWQHSRSLLINLFCFFLILKQNIRKFLGTHFLSFFHSLTIYYYSYLIKKKKLNVVSKRKYMTRLKSINYIINRKRGRRRKEGEREKSEIKINFRYVFFKGQIIKFYRHLSVLLYFLSTSLLISSLFFSCIVIIHFN